MNNLTVLIVAAGMSSRLNSSIPKPYIFVASKPVLWYSVNAFNNHDFVDKIFVVISEDMQSRANDLQKKFLGGLNKFAGFIIGGKTRRESAMNGLTALHKIKKGGFVAIHDAARPFISKEVLTNVFVTAKEVGASAPGIPVIDTIKICDGNGDITGHLVRNNLISIQTPQIFDFVKLWEAYNEVDINSNKFTDDTEVFGLKNRVRIVKGHNDLFKITYEEDLDRAKIICKGYEG